MNYELLEQVGPAPAPIPAPIPPSPPQYPQGWSIDPKPQKPIIYEALLW